MTFIYTSDSDFGSDNFESEVVTKIERFDRDQSEHALTSRFIKILHFILFTFIWVVENLLKPWAENYCFCFVFQIIISMFLFLVWGEGGRINCYVKNIGFINIKIIYINQIKKKFYKYL